MASPRAAGDTVAMTAVDEEGRAVTLIQSLYAHFGSGLLEPETGIVLHNRGGGFSLEPGHPGCLAPGARPPHTLCPSMVHAGDAVIAFGCQGGRAQPQILAQVASAVADPSSDLQAAVGRPRWIVGGADLGYGDGEIVLAEPGGGRTGRGGGERGHRLPPARRAHRQDRPRAGVAPGPRRVERRVGPPRGRRGPHRLRADSPRVVDAL